MKLEKKRYMIVEYAGTVNKIYDTQEEVDKVLADTRRFNDQKTAKYICGNISDEVIDGKHFLTIHVYNKLTAKNTITSIDNFTRNFTKPELIAYFTPRCKVDEGFSPDINIAYLESKDAFDGDKELEIGVKYIPIFYKGDEKYFNEEFIKKCLAYHARKSDTDFFIKLAHEFEPHHSVTESVEKIRHFVDGVLHLGYNPMCLYHEALSLYRKLIAERDHDGSITRDTAGNQQISNRRKRDFAFFIKNYGARKNPSPLKYNGSVIEMKKQELLAIREGLVMRPDIQTGQLLLTDVSKKRRKKQ